MFDAVTNRRLWQTAYGHELMSVRIAGLLSSISTSSSTAESRGFAASITTLRNSIRCHPIDVIPTRVTGPRSRRPDAIQIYVRDGPAAGFGINHGNFLREDAEGAGGRVGHSTSVSLATGRNRKNPRVRYPRRVRLTCTATLAARTKHWENGSIPSNHFPTIVAVARSHRTDL